MFQNDLLAGKRILVTGGGTGLGAAMARRFAELGANLVLTSRRTRPGDHLDEMLRKLHRGLFVTELMGQGVNGVTGDYSRGAAGFWVEGGRIVHPVHEVTIAGNLREMFQAIAAIGADVYNSGSKSIGSVIVDGMKLAGA